MASSIRKVLYEEEIPIDKIYVSDRNSRGVLDYEKLDEGYKNYLRELAESIRAFGLLNPVEVWKTNDQYELLVGQNRYLACKNILKQSHIRARVIEAPSKIDALLISAHENLHRKDVPLRRWKEVVSNLYDELGKDPYLVAKRLGKSIEWVKDLIALRLAPDEVTDMVDAKKISRKDAINIVGIWWPDRSKMIKAATIVSSMSRDERDAFFEKAKEMCVTGEIPDPADVKVEPPTYTPLRVRIHAKYIPALDKAAEDLGVDRDDVVTIAVIEWLQNRYGIS